MPVATVKSGTLKMMLHAIGYRPEYIKGGKYLYYRNYYGTSPENIRNWERLADKGYARRDGDTGIFVLTRKGLDHLVGILGIEIYDKYAGDMR